MLEYKIHIFTCVCPFVYIAIYEILYFCGCLTFQRVYYLKECLLTSFDFEMQRQKADALMKTANECKDQLLQKEIDHNMKVAKMIQELKDQLSKEKIKIIEEKSATEARNYPNMKRPLKLDDIT
jgi:hypothetical protein